MRVDDYRSIILSWRTTRLATTANEDTAMMIDPMTAAQKLAAETHPAIGVLCREGRPVFYAMLDNRDMAQHGFGSDFITIEHTDIGEVLAYLPKAEVR